MNSILHFKKSSTHLIKCIFTLPMLLLFSVTVSAQVNVGFQGGEIGDTWGYTSTGASALSISEATQSPNKVTGTTSLVVGGNTGGGNCFATGSGNGPNTPRTFTFDQLDISSSNTSTRTLTFNWGNRFPSCNGTGWDSGENLTFTAFHNGVSQGTFTLAVGNNNAQFSILSNSYTWTIPPCVSQFSFIVSVTTNRADELLFIDDVLLTAPQLNGSLTAGSISGNTSVCAGSSENYSVTSQPGISYNWSGLPAGASFTTINGSNGSSAMTIDWGTAAPGNYILSLIPENACGNSGTTETLTVTVLAAPTPITISGPSSICSGTSITLTSNYVSGNTWSTGETTQSISVTSVGNYTVSVVTPCGTISASQQITLNTSTQASLSINGPTSFCPGNSVTLSSNVPSGNIWSTGATTQSISVSSAGNYILTVTDVCGSTSDSLQITLLPLPSPQISGLTSFCAGQQTTLTASGGDSYLWSTGETNASIVITTAGNYSLTATNSCGQSTSNPITVSELPLPNPQITGNSSFCTGQQTTLTASGGDTYLWSTVETTNSIVVNTPGNFTLTAINSCGQSTSNPLIVTELPLPNPQITGNLSFCAGQQTVLTASGGNTYQWSTGEITNSITVTSSGNYTLTATNSCGQTTSNPVTVIEISLPVTGITGNTDVCEGEQTILTASGGDTYLWSTGQITTSIPVNVAGTYTVSASNSCGTTTANVNVTVSANSALFTVNTLSGYAPLIVDFNNLSNPIGSSFIWNFDDGSTETTISPSHMFNHAGFYNVELVASNANGCSATYSLTIEVLDSPSSIEIPNVFTPNGDQVNDYFTVKAELIETYQLQILNRWGNLIITINNPNEGWDGTIHGDQASEGTYFYQITATGIDKKNYNETGFFMLQR